LGNTANVQRTGIVVRRSSHSHSFLWSDHYPTETRHGWWNANFRNWPHLITMGPNAFQSMSKTLNELVYTYRQFGLTYTILDQTAE